MKFVNLKKVIHFSPLSAIFSIMAVSVIFFSCTNLANQNLTSSESAKKGLKTISLNVTSDEGYILFGEKTLQNEKSIIPITNSSDLIYYLVYKDMHKSNGWVIEEDVPFSPISETIGTINRAFEPSYYTFNIYALTLVKKTELHALDSYGEADIKRLAAFNASTFVDFTYTSSVVFHLRTSTNSTSFGDFSVTISHENGWLIPNNYKVTLGLYDMNNETLIEPSSGAITVRGYNSLGVTINNYTFNNQRKIKSGEYNVTLKYIACDNYGNGIKEFEYSEKIVILMNQKTEGTMIVPDFLDSVPKAPSCFIAGYKEPETKDSSLYSVQFRWYDNSSTENYFKLQIINIPSSGLITMPKTDLEWEILAGNYGYGNVLSYGFLSTNNTLYTIDGSLAKNTDSLTLKVPLGKRYIARLCATNPNGDSDWAYLTLPQTLIYTDPTDVQKTVALDNDYLCFDDDVTTINLYRIRYELDSGVFTADDGVNPAHQIKEVDYFESQHNLNANSTAPSDKVKVLLPDGFASNTFLTESDAKLTLTDRNRVWYYWSQNVYDATGINPNKTYVAAPAVYKPGILYYADESGTFANPQPEAATYDSTGLYVANYRAVAYQGYENITYFAHYKDVGAALDLSAYHLRPEYLTLSFMNIGNWVTTEISEGVNISDKDSDGTITCADMPGAGYIEISRSKVSLIRFMLNDNAALCHYNSVKLTVTRNFDSYKMIENQEMSNSKMWEVGITGETTLTQVDNVIPPDWFAGSYYVQFDAISSDYPEYSFGYGLVLNIKA